MKMQDVRAMAKSLRINSFGKTKSELIREIQRKEGNFDCYGTAVNSCDQEDCCFYSACLAEQTVDKKRGKKS